MNIEYLGLDKVNGPLVFLSKTVDVSYEETVLIKLSNGELRKGRVIEIFGDTVCIQVFEGTVGLGLDNTRIKFLNKPITLGVSDELLGRVFNGSGEPIDGMGSIFIENEIDINGKIINPVSRVYPRNFIQTGISSIDALTTLIRGQKLPIFSGDGLPHNELAVEIVKNSGINDNSDNFCIVFAAMGVKNDVADYFKKSFIESKIMSKVVMFINIANDPIIERILTPRFALTAAEYLAFEKNMHVLVILTDMTAYCEALRELSSSKGEIPGRKGFPGYMYSDLASIYERAGMIKDKKGSVTQIPILTMPNDDITHPIPDLTGYITEGQITLDRDLHKRGIFPPIGILPSLSRLMKDGIGKGYTREDHQAVSNQLFAAYARVQDAKSLAAIIGEDELNDIDKKYLLFGDYFENYFLNQTEKRTIEETLDLGWDLISLLPINELNRIDEELLKKYYNPLKAYKRFNITLKNKSDQIIDEAKDETSSSN